jgi:WD40 repeat protein
LPHGNSVWDVDFSTDGARVVTTSSDNLAQVWDAKTGKLLSVMGKVLAAVKNLAFSADGKSIITAHVDGKVGTWDVQTGRLIAITGSGESPAGAASFSPDGMRIAEATGFVGPMSTKDEHVARIWKEGVNEPAFELRDRAVSVNEAWFNADGTLALTVNTDFTAKVWDAATGKSLVELGSSASVNVAGPAAAISSNNKFVALTSPDGQVRVWDLVNPNRKPLTALPGHGEAVQSVAFSPDNTTVLAIYVDGTARLFVVDCLRAFGELYEDAVRLLRILKKNLTEDELQKYLNESVVE